MPEKKKRKRPLLKGVLYLFYLILLTELSLRLLGYLYLLKVKKQAKLSQEKNQYLIYCYGDSNVFGIGAPTGFSFPAQLQLFLDKYSSDKKFLVVNSGIPGYNSAQAAEKMESEVQRRPPHMAIVLVGANNLGNLYKLRFLELFQSASPSLKIHLKLLYFFQNLRLVKVFNYFFPNRTDIVPVKNEQGVPNQLFYLESIQLEMLKADIKKMKELSQKFGFRLLFLTYPKEEQNRILKKAFLEEGVEYQDNEQIFQPYLPNSKELVICSDGHPNLVGYSLIALHLLSYLWEHDLFRCADTKNLSFLDSLKLKLKNGDLYNLTSDIFPLIFSDKNASQREFLAEISTPQAKFERIKIYTDTKAEIYLKNGIFYMVNYPDFLNRIDYRLLVGDKDEKFIKLVLGEPLEVKSYADRNITLFDQKWTYKKNISLNIFFKKGIAQYLFLSKDFPFIMDIQTAILDQNPTTKEIYEVFGPPSLSLFELAKSCFIYYYGSHILVIIKEEKDKTNWNMHFNNLINSLFNSLLDLKLEHSRADDLVKILGNPDMRFSGTNDYQLLVWKEKPLLAIIRAGIIHRLLIISDHFLMDKFLEEAKTADFERLLKVIKIMYKFLCYDLHRGAEFDQFAKLILFSLIKSDTEDEIIRQIPTGYFDTPMGDDLEYVDRNRLSAILRNFEFHTLSQGIKEEPVKMEVSVLPDGRIFKQLFLHNKLVLSGILAQNTKEIQWFQFDQNLTLSLLADFLELDKNKLKPSGSSDFHPGVAKTSELKTYRNMLVLSLGQYDLYIDPETERIAEIFLVR